MLHGRWSGIAFDRVNPFVPAAVAVVGAFTFLIGFRFIGVGLVAGACLGLLNALLLSHRVELAADTGDVGRALLAMQLTLLLTCTVIGVAAVVMIRFSIAMTVACVAGFAVTHLGILTTFYITRGRRQTSLESKST